MEFLQKTSFAPIRILREGFMEGISETIPGFKWVKWTFYLSFMSLSLLSLLGFSGLSESIIESVRRAFSEGFYVGTILINISNILVATFILGILIIISWMLKQKIERKNAQSNEMEIGGQAAKAALFWYASIVTSFLIALSVSGFSVQNLALIAGAFSVGIGFGLQNIVSNFISGIILLIERPVKPGDWVRIGDTEGFIQKISIRATQLRTFDKADILVPNSELISNHVTNMMLSDSVGRIKVEVGVAYGSDTAKVKEILETIINENDAIVKNDEALTPSIIFKAFGDSSLNFEVRGFIRDISEIFRVRSQIHFAIDNAFRENGIEIPFPQRDLHVKTWFGKKDMPKESDND